MKSKSPPQRFYKLTRRMWLDSRVYALSTDEKAALICFLLEGQANGEWQVQKSVRALANDLHISPATAARVLNDLQDKGFLQVVHRATGNSCATYRIASWLYE
jgi:DNA-binding MarR family transcriptional regulator